MEFRALIMLGLLVRLGSDNKSETVQSLTDKTRNSKTSKQINQLIE